jgi:hypothetical protein
MSDKLKHYGYTKKQLVGAVSLGALTLGLAAGGTYSIFGGVGMPFLPITSLLAFVLFALRKDIPFNLKLLAYKFGKKNPRVIYHADSSKSIQRMIVPFNDREGTAQLRSDMKVELTPKALLVDSQRNIMSAIHVGAEKTIRDLFETASDFFTAKQVDLMLKDAEQLGELRSTEKLDKIVKYALIALVIVAIGAGASVMTLMSMGELTQQIDKLIPLLQGIPEIVKNSLVR